MVILRAGVPLEQGYQGIVRPLVSEVPCGSGRKYFKKPPGVLSPLDAAVAATISWHVCSGIARRELCDRPLKSVALKSIRKYEDCPKLVVFFGVRGGIPMIRIQVLLALYSDPPVQVNFYT